MNADDFTIPTGKALFVDPLQPPTTAERLALRNNGAFRYLAARVKERHHDTTDPVIRENLRLVMAWMDELSTPQNQPKKERGKEDENEDDGDDDLTTP